MRATTRSLPTQNNKKWHFWFFKTKNWTQRRRRPTVQHLGSHTSRAETAANNSWAIIRTLRQWTHTHTYTHKHTHKHTRKHTRARDRDRITKIRRLGRLALHRKKATTQVQKLLLLLIALPSRRQQRLVPKEKRKEDEIAGSILTPKLNSAP